MNKIWWVDPEQLDKEQKDVLRLPVEGKHLVTGPPGSGKSNLLILRARLLVGQRKQNFRILAFTQTLVRFLRASNAVPEDKVATATSWLDQQLWELSGARVQESDLDKRRPLVASAILDHLRLNKMSGLIHTLLIDEVQDYSREEIELFSEIAENLFLVGDIRQKIHKSNTSHADLEAMKGEFNVVDLRLHYRIGRSICALADRLASVSKGHESITDGCQYDEQRNPSSVTRIVAPLGEQIKQIIGRVATQLDTFPEEFIGILCPTRTVLEAVTARLEESEFGDRLCIQKGGAYQDFDLEKPVIVSTIHGAKGLEYRCVHIPSAESLKRFSHNRELIYTAVTRAKTTVSIYHEAQLHDYLEDALSADTPPPPPPSLDSLFNNK